MLRTLKAIWFAYWQSVRKPLTEEEKDDWQAFGL